MNILFARVLTWMAPALWWVVGGVIAALFAWGGAQTFRIKLLKAEAAEVEKVRLLTEASATRSALQLSEKYRALEVQLQAVKEQAQHEYNAAQTRNATALAAARAGADKLRNQLAAYASGAGEASGDSLAASNQ